MKFSANTGFLWTDRPFLERVARARDAGFDAVEFHDEAQGEDPDALRGALGALPVRGLNVRMGDTVGCAAIPGSTARADFEAALAVAETVDAAAIHVLAGRITGDAARDTYLETLAFAADRTTRTILIEPLCVQAVPGYHLRRIGDAAEVIAQLGRDNVKVMFDVFHIAMEEGLGAVVPLLEAHRAIIGHVQTAGLPARAEPLGLQDRDILRALDAMGYDAPVGLEYRPTTSVEGTLAALRDPSPAV